ncbi:hypothetical protein OS176_04875 [Xanthomonadaceae bacterium XH05]|nr:hypothetical protein [Xanthomonadaceae bacterium XH05]
MRAIGRAIQVASVAMLLTACGDGESPHAGNASSGDEVSGAPSELANIVAEAKSTGRVSSVLSRRQQERLDEAMTKAREGKSPTQTCAILTGVVAGTSAQDGGAVDPERAAVFEACYVDASVAFVKTQLDAMTKAGDEDARNNACTSAASHLLVSSMSIGGYAGNVGLDVKALNEKIAQQLGADALERCPPIAEFLKL